MLEITDGMTNRQKRSVRLHNARLRGTHTKRQWEKLKEYCGPACPRCGELGYNLEKDHIIPIYAGGCDCIQNIQPLCARCNASKGPESKDFRKDDWKIYVFEDGPFEMV